LRTGTCLSIAAGIATIATAGAAIPFLIGSLMWTGVGVGAVGAGLKIGGGIHGSKAKKVLKNLEEAIKEDLEAHKAFKDKLSELQMSPKFSEKLYFKVLKASSSPGGNALVGYAEIVGVSGMISFIETILRPLNKTCCTNPILQELIDNMITAVGGTLTSTLTEISEQAASTQAGKIAAEAVRTMEEGFVKKQAHAAARLAAEELLKSSSDDVLAVAAATGTNEAVKAVATEVAKQTSDDVVLAAAKVATNETAKVASSEAAKVATKEVANEAAIAAANKAAIAAAEKTAETLTKVAGGITVGLGAFFLVWDVYNTIKDGKKKSLGDTLRELADELEEQT
jgi:hypothetical protein